MFYFYFSVISCTSILTQSDWDVFFIFFVPRVHEESVNRKKEDSGGQYQYMFSNQYWERGWGGGRTITGEGQRGSSQTRLFHHQWVCFFISKYI